MLLATAQERSQISALEAARRLEKRSFPSHDGTALFYRHWTSRQLRPTGAIILLHREHEHSGRVQHLVDELNLPEFAFFAWDARGHGCSPGMRGDAISFGTLTKDLDTFVRHVGKQHGMPISRIHIVAHGASAVLAATWVQDYAARIGSLVLAAPAFECRGLAGLAPGALRSLYQRRGNVALRTYARPEDLTQDIARRASYAGDPLIGKTTTARLLIGLQDAARRVTSSADGVDLPVQLLIAGADRLVRRRPQLAYFNALGTQDKELHTFDGFAHDVLGERDRQRALDAVHAFIRRHASTDHADPRPATGRSSAYPLKTDSPLREVRRAASRTSLRTLGRTSVGIGLALDGGLDSAAVVDHVCRNVPAGTSALGRLLDGRFLASRAARTLRARNANIERAIVAAADHVRTSGLPVRIVDITAGNGRHVIDAMHRLPALPDSALLCDTDEDRVAEGRRLARARNVNGNVRFVRPERIDARWIASLAPHTTIAIASLHLSSGDEFAPVAEVLSGLARAVPPGGCLIYTAGPRHAEWHRQAAALLPSDHDDPPNRRIAADQGRLDRCVEAAGFQLLDRWVDEWGVFGVSISVRIGAEAAMRELVAR